MASIASALVQIKQDPQAVIGPGVTEGVCRELGLEWKNTPLTPPVTLGLFAQQILRGNISNPEFRRAEHLAVTAEAFCIAKGRLPVELLQELGRRVRTVAVAAAGKVEDYLWKGHRTWHEDGSSFSMPDTPELQARFGQPGNQQPGCGFPVAHILCLFGAVTGLIRELLVAPLRTHDLALAGQLPAVLQAGDVLIGDTAFGSFFHLVSLQIRGIFAVFPNHQRRIVSFRPHRAYRRPQSRHGKKGLPTSRWLQRLGKDDQLVEYLKPARPKWMTLAPYAAMPATLVVRELRWTLRRPGFRAKPLLLVTTLLDPERYPAADLVELSRQRWGVETNLRHLKTTMKLEVLRSHSSAGIDREVAMYELIYNLVRVILMEAAQQQEVDLDRISFADALYWLRYTKESAGLPRLIVNPDRPDRVEPRAVKRRPKEFDRLTKPRDEMRKAAKRAA
jgi:hypothetical protein